MRHDWVEVKDGVLHEYPIYRCIHCLTTISARMLAGISNSHDIHPSVLARYCFIKEDCEEQLVQNLMES